MLERDTDYTRLAITGRKPVDLGPRVLLDPLVNATVRYQLRRDDVGVEMKPPLLARLMERLAPAARTRED